MGVGTLLSKRGTISDQFDEEHLHFMVWFSLDHPNSNKLNLYVEL